MRLLLPLHSDLNFLRNFFVLPYLKSKIGTKLDVNTNLEFCVHDIGIIHYPDFKCAIRIRSKSNSTGIISTKGSPERPLLKEN